MKEFKISQSESIINDIVTHLKNGHMGAAILRNWKYKREGNTIYFNLKKDGIINLADILWFGYLTNN
ncbi:hypothetical protein [Elizabethkingia anophelis]|uniref:hypothetical protein n=1 Tax=Elizabethkingia anophelis TaxID=1117645 RepID=UPI0008401A33|nr:hypothetical protein [Elizabethkingia anophelis]MCT4238451.1 hypothetical protein [Elizabethkingia anophelis]OCW75090.1 hypothetical protein A4G24_08445 [Elizabethkingia anophelis]